MLGRGCDAGLQVKHRHNDLQVPCVSGVRTVAAVTRREDKTASPALIERFKLPGPQAGVPPLACRCAGEAGVQACCKAPPG